MKIKIAVILALFVVSSYAGGIAHLGVKVVDSETGQPIPKIKVYGGFKNYSKGWGIAAKNNSDEDVTDSDGFCRLSGRTEAGHSSCIVRGNEGFYDSGWYSFDYEKRSALKFGRWIPDDMIITVRLDRVINPIPLYVKNAKIQCGKTSFAEPLPLRESFSYDLLKGDWLPPYGKGKISDINFSIKRVELGFEPHEYPSGIKTNEFYRYDVKIGFNGLMNGMIEEVPTYKSMLKLRIAPIDGYEPARVCWRGRLSRTEYKNNYNPDRCYYIRIRTELDENGVIKKAYYGKIYGDFDLRETKNALTNIKFLYYLNPTPNDRNLEWDMKTNLCPVQKRISNPQP